MNYKYHKDMPLWNQHFKQRRKLYIVGTDLMKTTVYMYDPSRSLKLPKGIKYFTGCKAKPAKSNLGGGFDIGLSQCAPK